MVGGRAGLNPVGDGKDLLLADRQILAAQRIAVDGGIGEGRQGQRRREVLRQDAAVRQDEGDRFRAFDHAQPRGQQGDGVLDRQHRSAKGKAVIRQLRHRRNIVLFCRRRASAVCPSAARRNPSPNSALSSKSEFDQAGPRPSALVVHGVGGRFPP